MNQDILAYTSSNVLPVDDGAGRYILSKKSTQVKVVVWCANSILDIRGGIASKQWGLVFYKSQAVLNFGIDAYLLNKGYDLPSAQHARLALIFNILKNEKEFCYELHNLLFFNPERPEEVMSYANECIRFVEDRLGMKSLLNEWGWFGNIFEHARFELMSDALIKYLKEENIIYEELSTEFIELRDTIREKLAPSLNEKIVSAKMKEIPIVDRKQQL